MSAVVLGWGPDPSSLQWARELCGGDQRGLPREGVSEQGAIHAATAGLCQANVERKQQQKGFMWSIKQQNVQVWGQTRAGSYRGPDTS